MKRYFQILSVLLIIFCNSIIAQENNKSFIYSDFSSITNYPITSICSTVDGGFAYLGHINGCLIDLNEITYFKFKNNKDEKCINNFNYCGLLFKVNCNDQLKQIKVIRSNKNLLINSYATFIKQTSDCGFIVVKNNGILKLDNQSNTKWDINFDNDSIPDIKKSKFLSQAGISDIYECKDGSFIALLSASYSLLKISKDGKPLWLKSTVFKEFSPMYFDYYPKQKQWIEKTDSLGINTFVWQRGGGVYIPTFEIYETDDSGYIAIGKNEYRYKDFITDYSDSNKIIFTTQDLPNGNFERYKVANPERIYGIRKYPIGKQEKDAFTKQGTTCVVKTDKNGKVIWTKQFGEYSWGLGDNLSGHSDLIKLANNKWLIRIRDCHKLKENTYPDSSLNSLDWTPASSRIFIIDNDGNILKEKWIGDNAFNLCLAIDSGYFANRQYDVTKYDKNFNLLWSQGTDVTTRAYSSPLMSAMSDSGVVCDGGGGYIIKIDKNGNPPLNDLIVSIRTNSDTVFFQRHLKGMKNRNAKLIIKPLRLLFYEGKYDKDEGWSQKIKERAVNEKDLVKRTYIFDSELKKYRIETEKKLAQGLISELPEDYYEYEPINPGIMKRYLDQNSPKYKYGITNNKPTTNEERLEEIKRKYEFIFDITDKYQLNSLMINASGVQCANYIECFFGGSDGITIVNMQEGKYEYEIIGDDKNVIYNGEFEIRK